MDYKGIEDCVKKVAIVMIDGQEWLHLEERCSCQYYGVYKLGGSDFRYCRNRKLYFKRMESGKI
jgi:hypothetical protein